MFLEVKPKHIKTSSVSADYDEEVYTRGRLGGPINRNERRLYAKVLDRLGHPYRDRFNPDLRLLDIACGTGKFLAYASHYMSVAGIDISPTAIEKARQRIVTGALCVGAGEALPFEDERFDYITCFGSLEHFLDMLQGLSEMRRCLKRNGRLFLLVPNLYGYNNTLKAWLHNETPRTGQIVERLACADGWCSLIENAGFRVMDFYGISFRRRLLTLTPFGVITPMLNLLSNLFSMLIPTSMHTVFCFFAEIET